MVRKRTMGVGKAASWWVTRKRRAHLPICWPKLRKNCQTPIRDMDLIRTHSSLRTAVHDLRRMAGPLDGGIRCHHLRPNTLRSYEQHLVLCSRILAARSSPRVTRLDIQKLNEAEERGASTTTRVWTRTVGQHGAHIHAMLHRCSTLLMSGITSSPITQRTVSSCPRATTNQSRFDREHGCVPAAVDKNESGVTSSTRS